MHITAPSAHWPHISWAHPCAWRGHHLWLPAAVVVTVAVFSLFYGCGSDSFVIPPKLRQLQLWHSVLVAVGHCFNKKESSSTPSLPLPTPSLRLLPAHHHSLQECATTSSSLPKLLLWHLPLFALPVSFRILWLLHNKLTVPRATIVTIVTCALLPLVAEVDVTSVVITVVAALPSLLRSCSCRPFPRVGSLRGLDMPTALLSKRRGEQSCNARTA